MQRDSFIFYRSFYEAISDLEDADRLACYEALMEYALNGVEPQGKGIVTAVFKSVKPQIDANNRKYINGCKGGRPKNNQAETEPKPNDNQTETNPKPKNNQNKTKAKPKQNQTKTNPEPNDNDNVNVNDNVNDNDKERGGKPPRFIPPTVDQVREYCTQRHNKVDPETFVAYYSSKNWYVGKNKMTDWEQAVITWEKRDKQKSSVVNFAAPKKIEEHDYGEGELERLLLEN